MLLHLCAQSQQSEPSLCFQAIHVHHGLQQSADIWVDHCQRVCASIHLPLTVRYVDAHPKAGSSPEAVARDARYFAIQSCLRTGDVVLTAQHGDDQAETVLLQLFRGGGLAGLAAMPVRRSFGVGFLMRPLLDYGRDDLQAYAQKYHLQWVDDPTNQEDHYDRNFLRQHVLPLLQNRWPGLRKSLQRSAMHCASALLSQEQEANEAYQRVITASPIQISINSLISLPAYQQNLALRTWFTANGLEKPPSLGLVKRILEELIPAREDRQPEVRWNRHIIRRYRNSLYLTEISRPVDFQEKILWQNGQLPSTLPLPGNGLLEASLTNGAGIALSYWQAGKITVGYRQGGERYLLVNRRGRRDFKHLCQEFAIPPWVRPRVPVVFIDNRIAAVAGFWSCAPFTSDKWEASIELHWLNHGLF